MDNIIENNKLIAEFMGLELPLKITEYSSLICSMNGNYHKDCNWLMEVVEKIENLEHCQIDISLNWCRIGYKGTLFNYDSRDYFKGLTKIEAVYNACVEFIKWYNEKIKRMNLYKKVIEEVSQEISWDNWKDEETGKYWEVPEVLYSKLGWVEDVLREIEENDDFLETIYQCKKLLETLDDNGIKKIK